MLYSVCNLCAGLLKLGTLGFHNICNWRPKSFHRAPKDCRHLRCAVPSYCIPTLGPGCLLTCYSYYNTLVVICKTTQLSWWPNLRSHHEFLSLPSSMNFHHTRLSTALLIVHLHHCSFLDLHHCQLSTRNHPSYSRPHHDIPIATIA